jgi:hypothetical protein
VVTKEDADSAVVIDMARNILGNPYEEGDGEEDPGGADPTAGVPDDGVESPGADGTDRGGDSPAAGTEPGPP